MILSKHERKVAVQHAITHKMARFVIAFFLLSLMTAYLAGCAPKSAPYWGGLSQQVGKRI